MMRQRFSRLLALLTKEFRQIRRDRRLAVSLVVPPTLQILLFGFALNSNVSDLKLAVLDESNTPESRELVASLTESKSFTRGATYHDERSFSDAIGSGKADAGAVIPLDFAKQIHRGIPVNIQFVLNASNANTASIGEGYAQGVLVQYNQTLASEGFQTQVNAVAADVGRVGGINLMPAYLYNPGLVTNWFILTGTLGILLILNGSLVASTAMIKEREAGTLEQLLMTPARTAEIILAKIAPLFLLLTGTLTLAIALVHLVFATPIRGSLACLFAGGLLCLLCGIGIGTMIATFTRSVQQAQLLSFFINPPLAALSGALAPLEAMPHWMKPLTYFNPVRYFGLLTRAVMLKGAHWGEVWVWFSALAAYAFALMAISVGRFRKQLS